MKINIDLENPCWLPCEECADHGNNLLCWKAKYSYVKRSSEIVNIGSMIAQDSLWLGWNAKEKEDLE